MKKTLTINLSGIVFHVEEDAYERLKHYLDAIKGHFSRFEENKEILEDIESRAAEQFGTKISSSKQVITAQDVEELIKIMGRVEDITGSPEPTEEKRSGFRKLFRNSNDMIIAGVCSGLAAYIGIDAVFIRLIFILSIFFGGAGVLAYLILWAITPETKTPADEMEMQGYPVTLSSIEQAIKEKMNTEDGQEGRFKRLVLLPFRILGKVLRALGIALKKIIPVIAIILGAAVFIGALAGLAGICVMFAGLAFNAFSSYIDFPYRDIVAGSPFYVGLGAAFLACAIPVVALLLSGISLIRRKSILNVTAVLAMIAIWIISLSTLAAVSLKYAPAFQARFQELENAPLAAKTFELKDFNRIETMPFYSLNVTKGDFKVSASARQEELDRLEIRVEDGTLKFNHKDNGRLCIFCHDWDNRDSIDISLPELAAIEINSSDRVKISGFDQKTMQVNMDGYSRLNFDSKVETLGLNMDGVSQATLKGSADSLNIKMDGMSSLEAYEFPAKKILIEITHSSKASVWAAETLDIHGDGLGKIFYKGDPKVTQQINNDYGYPAKKMIMLQKPGMVQMQFDPNFQEFEYQQIGPKAIQIE